MKLFDRQTGWQTWIAVAGLSVLVPTGSVQLHRPIALLAAEESANEAATAAEAAKVIDLNTLPLVDGAKVPFSRHLGSVTYEVDCDFKTAFQFHQKQLIRLGWKEVAGGVNGANNASVRFQNKGFTLSVMTYSGGDPDKPDMAMVTITNQGNVSLGKLPVVKGAKKVFVSEVVASYSSSLKSAEVVEATRRLLIDAGWETYGGSSNPPESEVMTFRKNAVRLTTFVGVSPVQKGQVMISYNTTLMSADLPALVNAKEVEFDDTQKALQFQTSDSFDAVAKSYQQRLMKSGWTSKTPELQKSKFSDDRVLGEMAFENEAKDSLLLRLTEEEQATQVKLSLRSAAEVAALQEQLKAAQEKLAAKEQVQKDEETKTKPTGKETVTKKPMAKSDDDGFPDVDSLIKGAIGDALKQVENDAKKPGKGNKNAAADKGAVSVPIPEGAKKVTQTSGNVLQIKWPGGKGQASAEALRDQLLAAGWEMDDDDKIEKTSGNVTFKKDGKQLTLAYVDVGIGDVNMMLIGIGVKLTEGKADPDAKVPAVTPKPKSNPSDEPSESGDSPRTSKKKSARKPSKSDGASDKPTVKLPQRVEKPNRGIAKLDKLPNEVKLVANGETIALPHIIAYETVNDDRWVTRILATETPIKQSSLIDLLRKNGADDELRSMSPRVFVELDDQDKLVTMSYAGNQSVGSAGESGVTGEAIVEEGRARGTFRAKKESEFFGRKIIGEVSFDLPVLTRDSQPTKQLANVKKLDTAGNLVVNGKTMKLAHFVAYQVKWNDETRTALLFSEKPINMAKLKESLAKDGTDDGYFDFSSHIQLKIDKDDRPSFLNLYADGASISQNTGLVGEVIVEDNRARGKVTLEKAIDFAGKNINFDLTFDLDVLPLKSTSNE